MYNLQDSKIKIILKILVYIKCREKGGKGN